MTALESATTHEIDSPPIGVAASGLPPLNDRRTQLIFDAALEVLRDQGIANTRVTDIAARAGVSVETLLVRFGDRDAIASTVVARIADQVRINPAILALPNESPATRLERLVLAALMQALNDRGLALLRLATAEGWRRPEFAKIYDVEIRQPTLTLAGQLAERFSERGQIQPECEDAFVAAFEGLLRGEIEPVVLGLRPAPDESAIRRHARAIARRMLRAFAPIAQKQARRTAEPELLGENGEPKREAPATIVA